MKPVGLGVDGVVDQVKRQAAFTARHPEVTITNPRQNGTREFIATWPDPDPDKGEWRSTELRRLLDYLEAKFRPLAGSAVSN